MTEFLEDVGNTGVGPVASIAVAFSVGGAAIAGSRAVADRVKSTIAMIGPGIVSESMFGSRELHIPQAMNRPGVVWT